MLLRTGVNHMNPWNYSAVHGHSYRPWRHPNGRIVHEVRHKRAKFRVDFDDKEFMSERAFRAWVELGQPDRTSLGLDRPLDNLLLEGAAQVASIFGAPLSQIREQVARLAHSE
jgi:hypothetical protein